MRRDHRTERGITRRGFHRLGAAALVAAGTNLLPGRAGADSRELVTELEENADLVASIKYVNESEVKGQLCSGCILYQAGENGRGKCTLFQKGLVSEKGWCLSWNARPAS